MFGLEFGICGVVPQAQAPRQAQCSVKKHKRSLEAKGGETLFPRVFVFKNFKRGIQEATFVKCMWE